MTFSLAIWSESEMADRPAKSAMGAASPTPFLRYRRCVRVLSGTELA